MPSLRKRPAPPEEPPKRATTATLSSKKEAKVVEREEPSLLHRLRNMWQFANLFQFIVLFNKALKLDENMDIEVCISDYTPDSLFDAICYGAKPNTPRSLQDLEFECQKPSSPMLLDIGVALLKVVSSRHGIK